MNYFLFISFFCSPFLPHLIFSCSHPSCCLCRFHMWAGQAARNDPPQHNSPATRIMSAEGEIKMKKMRRSSGEVRRQQDFMRPVQTHDESKEKQNSSDLKLQSWGAGRPTENTWTMFDGKSLYHVSSSSSTFWSSKLVSVMETCHYSRSEQTHFGNCCIRAFYGCLAELKARFSLSCCMCARVICALLCLRSRAWAEAGSHEGSVLEVQIRGFGKKWA